MVKTGRGRMLLSMTLLAVRLAVDAPNSMLNCDSYNISGGICLRLMKSGYNSDVSNGASHCKMAELQMTTLSDH